MLLILETVLKSQGNRLDKAYICFLTLARLEMKPFHYAINLAAFFFFFSNRDICEIGKNDNRT